MELFNSTACVGHILYRNFDAVYVSKIIYFMLKEESLEEHILEMESLNR